MILVVGAWKSDLSVIKVLDFIKNCFWFVKIRSMQCGQNTFYLAPLTVAFGFQCCHISVFVKGRITNKQRFSNMLGE